MRAEKVDKERLIGHLKWLKRQCHATSDYQFDTVIADIKAYSEEDDDFFDGEMISKADAVKLILKCVDMDALACGSEEWYGYNMGLIRAEMAIMGIDPYPD